MSVTVPDAYSVPGVRDTQNIMPGGDSLENKVSRSMNKGVHMNNDCHEGKRAQYAVTENWVARGPEVASEG